MRRSWIILVLYIFGPTASAYELATHARLTQSAYLRAGISRDGGIGGNVGIDRLDPKNPFGKVFYDIAGDRTGERVAAAIEESDDRMPNNSDPLSLVGWLMRGAICEDDLTTAGCVGGNLVEGRLSLECKPRDEPIETSPGCSITLCDSHYERGLSVPFPNGLKAAGWLPGDPAIKRNLREDEQC